MHTGLRYRLSEYLAWTWRDSLALLVVSTVPVILFDVVGWRWLVIPWVPVALIGTASAFVVGFKNNATYARAWEARTIWGSIVNSSRAWALQVIDFVRPTATLSEAEAREVHRLLIHRHIAWLTALRFQLRQPRTWERMSLPQSRKYQKLHYPVPEQDGELGAELARVLSPADHAVVMKGANRATHLLALQSHTLAQLSAQAVLEPNRHVALSQRLVDLLDAQGRCERIKNFPYPRQFATINLFFIRLFVFLVPFGLLQEFDKLGPGFVWLGVPFGFLVGWVFNAMERIGDATENPFEGSPNDVPISALSRTIEIDLRELLGESEIPAPLSPVNNILM
ncbi:MAG: bestrophin family protein [Gemmatimonadaceae bacterium]